MDKIQKGISLSIKDEKMAASDYDKLTIVAKHKGNKAVARSLRGIANDERRHKAILKKLQKKAKK